MSTENQSTLEKVTSIGGICIVIGAISDLAAPVGNYKLYALYAGIGVLCVGLALWRLKSLAYQHTQTALVFGVILSGISGYLLWANPELSVSTIAEVSDQMKSVQRSVLGVENTLIEVKEGTDKIHKAMREQAEQARLAERASWTEDTLLNAVTSRNFVGMEEGCKAGIRVRGWDAAVAKLHDWDRNIFRDDDVFEFLASKDCLDEAKFCVEPFDDVLIERATLSRIERICGTEVRKRYADQRASMLAQKAADERRNEENRQRSIEECVRGGTDRSFCESMNRRIHF